MFSFGQQMRVKAAKCFSGKLLCKASGVQGEETPSENLIKFQTVYTVTILKVHSLKSIPDFKPMVPNREKNRLKTTSCPLGMGLRY